MVEIQPYFSRGARQIIDYWRTAYSSEPFRVRGPLRFLQSLVQLEATHLTCVWTAQRDSVTASRPVVELRSRFNEALSVFADHATILLKTCTIVEAYEIAGLVTRTLDYIKGSSPLMDWAISRPVDAVQLLKSLEYVSFSHATASRLVTELRKNISSMQSRSISLSSSPIPGQPGPLSPSLPRPPLPPPTRPLCL